MLTKYFLENIERKRFQDRISELINLVKDKKVLLYGVNDEFLYLQKKYDLIKIFNPIGIIDKEFEETTNNMYESLQAISPLKINPAEIDYVVITNSDYNGIKEYLNYLGLDDKQIKPLFDCDIKDDYINYLYCKKLKIDKRINKLSRNLKNKSVLFYGAGAFLKTLCTYYDLSNFNAIGVTDEKYLLPHKDKQLLNYKIYSPKQIKELMPDCIIITTKYYGKIIEYIERNYNKDKKIKIYVLARIPFLQTIRNIFTI